MYIMWPCISKEYLEPNLPYREMNGEIRTYICYGSLKIDRESGGLADSKMGLRTDVFLT